MSTRKPKFTKGIVLTPDAIALEGIEGELKVDSGDGKLKATLGASSREIVTNSQTQTLSNKSIDADTSTISNLETDNLKSGVLNTSATLTGASNTQVPSALAAKDYADSVGSTAATALNDHITDASDAHDASAISVSAIPGLTATEAQAAFAEHQSEIEANATAISDHITDAVDAHDASAISNVPAGTIAATTVQAAVNELDGDIQDHINDTADAHDASAISNTPTGNLAATDVQGAVNELQGDIDTINTTLANKVTGPASATDEAVARFDLTTGKLIQNSVVTITDAGVAAGLTGITSSGTVDSTGTLQASANFVEGQSTDAATTGANATLTSPTTPVVRLTNASLSSIDMIASPVSGRVVTVINQTGNTVSINNNTGATAANRILTGTKGTLSLMDEASIVLKYDATEARWMIIGGSGQSAGSLDTIFQLTGLDVAQWATGDNATFLGGGTISGTFATETAAPMHGVASYKYTQAAGSLDDYMASPAQAVDPRFRGQQVTLFFPYKYDGATNDIEVKFYDVTNSVELTTYAFLANAPTTTMFKYNVFIPTTCASIRVGFHVKVLNSTKILEFDDVQLTSDNTVYASLDSVVSSVRAAGNGGTAITASVTDITFTEVSDSDNSWSGTAFTAKQAGTMTLSCSVRLTAATAGLSLALYKNGIAYASISRSGATSQIVTGAFVGEVLPGEIYTIRSTQSGTLQSATDDHYVNINLRASNINVVTSVDSFSTDSASLVYAPSPDYDLTTLADAPIGTFITFTYAITTNTRTQTTTAPTQTTSDMNANGIQLFSRAYSAASTAASPAVIAIQIGKGLKTRTLDFYKSVGKVTAGNLDYFQASADASSIGARVKDYTESTGILIIDAGYQATTNTNSTFLFSDVSTQSNGYIVINASKNAALAGVNVNQSGKLLRITPFTASGTWTKSYDVGYVVVEVQGGGAAGGAGAAGTGNTGGGGGGAGGYSKKLISRTALANSETVTVGAAAGTSSFGSHCSATGGTAGQAGGNSYGLGGAGGQGSSGNINLKGNDGGTGGIADAAGPRGFGGSGGAAPVFGGAGRGGEGSGTIAGVAGAANSGAGGGGGGYSGSVGAGGAGGTGVVYVYEYGI